MIEYVSAVARLVGAFVVLVMVGHGLRGVLISGWRGLRGMGYQSEEVQK
ncbi:MAG: hypothetical protein K8S97_16300 [Anaerolineae bacterium]|nr:hypothetical protein [Anaerolineae bacterium]